MTNSADPDQLASLEANDLELHCLQSRAYPGSAGQRSVCFNNGGKVANSLDPELVFKSF